MDKIAILFPGQGSQFNLMGEDFYEYQEYKDVNDKLYEIFPEAKKAYKGELDINETEFAQPILFANQIGIYEVVKNMFDLQNVSFAGFSLGEYSAYYATGKYDLETGFKIIKKRSELMASVKSDYKTKVVLGLTKEELTSKVSIINQNLENQVIISNYNLEKQLLINFHEKDEQTVTQQIKEAGAKRIVDLAVSGPFHTRIYAEVAKKFQTYISDLKMETGTQNLYLNLTGRKYNNENLSVIMHDHMVTGVAWKTEIETMINDGIDTFIELGSKSVVASMVKKINRNVKVITIENTKDLEKLEEIWNKK